MTCECGAFKVFKAGPKDISHSRWCPESAFAVATNACCFDHPKDPAEWKATYFKFISFPDETARYFCGKCCSLESVKDSAAFNVRRAPRKIVYVNLKTGEKYE